MKTKITKSECRAVACVILRSGFANVGNFVFFDSEKDARIYAEREGGRVVNEDGLADRDATVYGLE